MNKFNRTFLAVFAIALLIGGIVPVTAQDAMATVDPIISVHNVLWSGDDTPVEGAEAILNRMEHGLSMTMTTTGLEPGNAYTIWWIIMNFPENCSDECGFDDVFLMDDEGQFILNEDGLRQPNFAGREAAQISSLRATSMIAYEDGTAMFRAHLPIGDLTDDMLFGPGLINPMGAEVHIAVRSHGPAILEILSEQLFTAWGGCPDPMDRSPYKDIQVAIIPPPAQ